MQKTAYTLYLNLALEAAVKAGEKIMEVYQRDSFDVAWKKDHSPLTLADQLSHDTIEKHLSASKIPLLSEEGIHTGYNIRKHWNTLWIVDPLDGTREFVQRNGEFTVNIALVEKQDPVLGIIYVPVTRELFFAIRGQGAWKLVVDNNDRSAAGWIEKAERLNPVTPPASTLRVVASRSYMNAETCAYINTKEKEFERIDLVSKGSALKFCLVAEGLADCYPRYAPTMEWDTAAGQVIVEETGKKLLDLSTHKPMKYNRPILRNGWFLVE